MIKKIRKSYMFWIGWLMSGMLNLVFGFFDGTYDWKSTMIWGTVGILLIGVHIFFAEKEKEEE